MLYKKTCMNTERRGTILRRNDVIQKDMYEIYTERRGTMLNNLLNSAGCI